MQPTRNRCPPSSPSLRSLPGMDEGSERAIDDIDILSFLSSPWILRENRGDREKPIRFAGLVARYPLAEKGVDEGFKRAVGEGLSGLRRTHRFDTGLSSKDNLCGILRITLDVISISDQGSHIGHRPSHRSCVYPADKKTQAIVLGFERWFDHPLSARDERIGDLRLNLRYQPARRPPNSMRVTRLAGLSAVNRPIPLDRGCISYQVRYCR